MVKLKDIFKEEPTISWIRHESSQRLLMDLRSYSTLYMEAQWKTYFKAKASEAKYFMLLKKALDFAAQRVSLRKGLTTFPGYKRGIRGFILDDSFMDLLPEPEKSQAKHNVANMDCTMVLFEHCFLCLPMKYLRLLK